MSEARRVKVTRHNFVEILPLNENARAIETRSKRRVAVWIQVEGEAEPIYLPGALIKVTKDYNDQGEVTIHITRP